MKSYKTISNRHIFLKKKHFYLTLLGVVMSVALVTALMTLMYSLVENLRLNEIRSGGAYHLEISGLGIADANEIIQRPELESAGIVYGTETVSIGLNSKEVADYYGIKHKLVEISLCDKGALELLPLQPEMGIYPENPGEIIVSRWFIDNYSGDIGIGDAVTLSVVKAQGGEYTVTGTQNYKVTGILYNSRNISTNAIGRAAVLVDSPDNKVSSVTAYVRLAKGTSIYEFKDTIKSISYNAQINDHSYLMSLECRKSHMNVMGPVFAIGLFLTIIIIIATIAVIYNSFNISVMEKTSLYGLLRASGATPLQIRKLVYREAAYYSGIGIPIGTAIGIGVTYILLEFVGFEPFNFTGQGLSTFISPWFVLAGIAVGIITVYLSAYIPAVKAGRVTPIEAISGKKNISLEKPKRISRKTLLGKFAGLPGAMAAKNLIRNRRKFRITIFSIIISSILFIVFNTLVVYSLDANPNDPMGFDYYIAINLSAKPSGISTDDINYIKGLEGVNRVFLNNETGSKITVGDETFNMPILSYGDDNLSEYFKGSLPESMITDNRGILIPFYSVNEGGKKKIFEIGDFKPGDIIKCSVYDDIQTDFIIEQVHKEDFLIPNRPNQPLMLVSEATMQRIKRDNFIFGIYIDAEDDSEAVSNQIQFFSNERPWYTITDLSEREAENKRLTIQLSIFFYGFLAVIIMIGSLNILNTINTSLIQRRREFAILGSVGMTRKQLSRMVLIETLVQGIKAGLIGSAAGAILVFILYELFGRIGVYNQTVFSIPWGTLGITMAASIIISLVSCLAPMRKLRNQDIIGTIRSLE